eukprot:CAMPEP_0172474618 /NCGR_PEP_ID=MMETSP1065-20121228/69451_1 /TAXON_ID=265537 /ORGANISM="Amphiprora paludosa, Strain CCMP125" /LENGTH=350 /DNA_ID=CAMNT_0013232805 /DNA_START=85 /DNA_END=1137 /DNA_ORIENTATION=-
MSKTKRVCMGWIPSVLLVAGLMTFVQMMATPSQSMNLFDVDLLVLGRFPLVSSGAASSASVFSQERKSLYQYYQPTQRNHLSRNFSSQLCGSGPSYQNYFALNKYQRSSSSEDKMIFNLFFNHSLDNQDGEPKFYVELGAFNGHEESNSRFFDECLGWEGALIEANPRAYVDLIKNRPHAHRLSFAASCNATEEAQNKTVGFWTSPKPFTNAAQDASVNRNSYANNPNSVLENVPCGGLTAPLMEIVKPQYIKGVGNQTRIQFFSLDVEGMEPNVLQTLDLDKLFVDVFMVESSNSHCRADCESREKARDILKGQYGYILHERTIPRSDLYIHPESPYKTIFETSQNTAK